MGAAEKLPPLQSEVGNRIRQRRKSLDISQAKLAELIGTSYQQIQKYESGINQLTLGKLLQFAQTLNVDPSYFYEGILLEDLAAEKEENDVIAKRRGRPLNILLVEDNPADALLFSKAAEQFATLTNITCLNDTELVMDTLSRQAAMPDQAIDLVILDLSLPKINGLQLLKTLKSNSQTAMLPCLILTNSISRREMLEAYRLGAAGFIQKSLQLEDYRKTIETVIRYWLEVVALPTN